MHVCFGTYQKLENRQWMYKGRPSQWELTGKWKEKARQFVEMAFRIDSRPNGTWCPCSKCQNIRSHLKEVVTKHLITNGFTPFYHVWKFHGESTSNRASTVIERTRKSIPSTEFDYGIDDCLDDFLNANGPEGPTAEEETMGRQRVRIQRRK
jgi:hypothetical protein